MPASYRAWANVARVSSARMLPLSVTSPTATTNFTPSAMKRWFRWLITFTATEFGFFPSGEVDHCVSLMMPNLNGAASAGAAASSATAVASFFRIPLIVPLPPKEPGLPRPDDPGDGRFQVGETLVGVGRGGLRTGR
jgi:hypothetical protein